MVSKTSRIVSSSLFGVLAVAALSACDALVPGGEPDAITVEIRSTEVSEVALVTSTNFVFTTEPGCMEACQTSLQVLLADTTTVTVPFQRRYPFTSSLRYLVETYPLNGVTAAVEMRVFIDDEEWFYESRTLMPADSISDQETLLFTYEFRGTGG
ncbi:MAG: hypothetical protein OEZ65_07110 [Gemmatimonadota bacterium]|nr:hypothetical protein [Gemmatimonadota bacterium]MDH5759342.1 hypothetical protein [Gemmatimonadota bacterium]